MAAESPRRYHPTMRRTAVLALVGVLAVGCSGSPAPSPAVEQTTRVANVTDQTEDTSWRVSTTKPVEVTQRSLGVEAVVYLEPRPPAKDITGRAYLAVDITTASGDVIGCAVDTTQKRAGTILSGDKVELRCGSFPTDPASTAVVRTVG